MSNSAEGGTLWLFWPFVALWKLLTFVLSLTGRIICALIGLVFMAAGVAISLTVVGAPLGVPLAALGMLLLIRSLF